MKIYKYKVGDIVWVKIPNLRNVKNENCKGHAVEKKGGCTFVAVIFEVYSHNNKFGSWDYVISLPIGFSLEYGTKKLKEWAIVKEWVKGKVK